MNEITAAPQNQQDEDFSNKLRQYITHPLVAYALGMATMGVIIALLLPSVIQCTAHCPITGVIP